MDGPDQKPTKVIDRQLWGGRRETNRHVRYLDITSLPCMVVSHSVWAHGQPTRSKCTQRQLAKQPIPQVYIPIGKQSNKKCVSSHIYKDKRCVSGGFLPKWEHQWTVKEVEAGLGESLAPLPTSSVQCTLRSPLSKRVTKELAQVSNIWQHRTP